MPQGFGLFWSGECPTTKDDMQMHDVPYPAMPEHTGAFLGTEKKWSSPLLKLLSSTKISSMPWCIHFLLKVVNIASERSCQENSRALVSQTAIIIALSWRWVTVSRPEIFTSHGEGSAELSAAPKQYWKELGEYRFSSVVLLLQEDIGKIWGYQILNLWTSGSGEKIPSLFRYLLRCRGWGYFFQGILVQLRSLTSLRILEAAMVSVQWRDTSSLNRLSVLRFQSISSILSIKD